MLRTRRSQKSNLGLSMALICEALPDAHMHAVMRYRGATPMAVTGSIRFIKHRESQALASEPGNAKLSASRYIINHSSAASGVAHTLKAEKT